jgi:hypothetical protein
MNRIAQKAYNIRYSSLSKEKQMEKLLEKISIRIPWLLLSKAGSCRNKIASANFDDIFVAAYIFCLNGHVMPIAGFAHSKRSYERVTLL